MLGGNHASSLTRIESASDGPHEPRKYGCTMPGWSRAGWTTAHVPSTMSWRAKRRSEPCSGVAEQPLVGVLALAEGGGEVDVDVDVLAVEVRPRRLGLQHERDPVVLAEPEPDQVALRRGPAGFVEQHAAAARAARSTASVAFCGQRLADADVPRHAGPAPRVDLEAGRGERLDVESGATPGSSR